MKEIKIQFDFGITNKRHTLYDSYFDFPPKGVIYEKSEFVGVNKKSFNILREVYYKIKKILGKFPFERKIVNSLRKDTNFDLIHFANHLGKTKNPFVADYETVNALTHIENKKNGWERLKSIMEDKNLKKLLPMNNESLKSFELFFGDSVNKKQEVLYPVTFVAEKFRKPVKKEKVIVFAGSSNIRNDKIFYMKGGYETLIAFDELSKKHKDYQFIFIGDIPKDIVIPQRENLIVKKVMPLEELYEIMNKSKIFFQPCYSTPATIFLMAMWFKLPIITYDYWANKEYVNSKNGLLIKPLHVDILKNFNVPIITPECVTQIKKNSEVNSKKLEEAVEKLIKNEKMMSKMGNYGFNLVSKGKFSIENRNKKLLKIYKEALK